MDVMTFNLRFENDFDGENSWRFRQELLAGVVERHAPSLLGTQEGTASQLRYLEARLRGYRMHAPPSRYWERGCQYPTIFYRESEFRVRDGGEFWLSLTPSEHRSKSWDSSFPRMMSYGLFEEIGTGRNLWVVVTHLDHIGPQARGEQAGMIARWVMQHEGPCILMGDFNDCPASPVHLALTSLEVGLSDTWSALNRAEDETSMTYHAFTGVPQIGRIDWILSSADFNVRDALIVRDGLNGRYPSDHFPYTAELQWSEIESQLTR